MAHVSLRTCGAVSVELTLDKIQSGLLRAVLGLEGVHARIGIQVHESSVPSIRCQQNALVLASFCGIGERKEVFSPLWQVQEIVSLRAVCEACDSEPAGRPLSVLVL